MFGREGGGRLGDASPFAQPDRHTARLLSTLSIIALILFPRVIVITIAESAVFRSRNEPPGQPIDFSHKIHHAGNYRISCLYCHTNARRSPVRAALGGAYVLVVPALWKAPAAPMGFPELLISAGFAGAAVLSYLAFIRCFPILPLPDTTLDSSTSH